MASGLDFLLDYPYGCTEQQLSRARAYLALRRFRDAPRSKRVRAGLAARGARHAGVDPCGDRSPDGLVAYWPGADGYVSLTAWVVQFLIEAREAGFAVDEAVLDAAADEPRAGPALGLQPLHRRRVASSSGPGRCPPWPRRAGSTPPTPPSWRAGRSSSTRGPGAGACSPSPAPGEDSATTEQLSPRAVGRTWCSVSTRGARSTAACSTDASAAQPPHPAERDPHPGGADAGAGARRLRRARACRCWSTAW